MATTTRHWGKWLLGLLVLVSLAVIGGWKWMEHLSLKEEERTRLFAQEQKEKRERARKLATAEKNAAENKKEAERLQSERDFLEERTRECKKPIVKKRVARAKVGKKVVVAARPKPKPPEAPPKVIAPIPKKAEAPAEKQVAKEEEKLAAIPAPAPAPKKEEAVAQKEEKVEKKETPPALQAPPQASGYQLGGACTLSDGTPGMVTATFRNGNVQCSEVVLVPVPSKAKAAAQYIVCTTAGAAVGYYNGGTYSAISGGVGGAGGTYLGRKLGGEDWGWVGCVTGPVAGFIRYGGAEKTARPIAGGPVNPTAGGGPVNPTP